MKLRLEEGVLTSYNPDTGMGVAIVKVIDEDNLIVEVDAVTAYTTSTSVEPPYPEERWKLTTLIRPKYLAGAMVEIIQPERGGWKVQLIQTDKPMPRNAQFARTFTVRRSHLASRA